MWNLAILAMLSFQNPSSVDSSNLRCGLWCLYVCLSGLDIPSNTLEDLETDLGQPTLAGYSLLQLQEAAERLGAKTLAVRTTVEELRRKKRPFSCIALLQRNHFVVLYDADDTSAHIIDPPREYTLPLDTFRSLWDGTALLISPYPLDAQANRWRSHTVWFFSILAFVFFTGGVIVVIRKRRLV